MPVNHGRVDVVTIVMLWGFVRRFVKGGGSGGCAGFWLGGWR